MLFDFLSFCFYLKFDRNYYIDFPPHMLCCEQWREWIGGSENLGVNFSCLSGRSDFEKAVERNKKSWIFEAWWRRKSFMFTFMKLQLIAGTIRLFQLREWREANELGRRGFLKIVRPGMICFEPFSMQSKALDESLLPKLVYFKDLRNLFAFLFRKHDIRLGWKIICCILIKRKNKLAEIILLHEGDFIFLT